MPVLEQMPPNRDLPYFVRSVSQGGRPIIIEHVTSEWVESFAQTPEHLQTVLATGVMSLIAMPLVMRGQPLGVLVFGSSNPSRVYGPGDLRVAEALADRAAVAIENARLYRASVDATELRERVLGVVAHDLRNPLAAIRLQISALKRRAPEPERRSQKPVDFINSVATRMDRLIQDLLSAALIEVGELTMQPSRLSTSTMIMEAVDTQRPAASSSSLKLQLDLEPDIPDLWADHDRLLQVFDSSERRIVVVGWALVSDFTSLKESSRLTADESGSRARRVEGTRSSFRSREFARRRIIALMPFTKGGRHLGARS